MGGFAEAVRERVRRARAAVAQAQQEGDAYAVAVAEDELDDALRTARGLGLELPDAAAEAEGGDPA
ncbi:MULTISPECIES: hypothetical protein [Streptomyces]|uniref:hypothetical protein n=1 Tax=Streptomyces TaxID=1883 RepID=UPI0019647458|nr:MULTISPECIES: hypothetical protein [Streptomyces]QRX90138.1 hypothetical protein JNO44_04040 [Streptomyces noursei]UJB40069.1 hypothetical protein HRD51_03485 [Streptomyces sp. A1-5]